MAKETEYLKKILKSILMKDKSIQEVRNLDFVKVMNYTENNLEKVNNILKNQNLNELELIPEDQMSEETLLVMKFYDQENRFLIATVYDNDGLWQDPQVTNIFFVTNSSNQ